MFFCRLGQNLCHYTCYLNIINICYVCVKKYYKHFADFHLKGILSGLQNTWGITCPGSANLSEGDYIRSGFCLWFWIAASKYLVCIYATLLSMLPLPDFQWGCGHQYVYHWRAARALQRAWHRNAISIHRTFQITAIEAMCYRTNLILVLNTWRARWINLHGQLFFVTKVTLICKSYISIQNIKSS